MNCLRIAIDPTLIEKHGPEIHWIWRQLLSGIGWAWEEVSLADSCDIAYTPDPATAVQAKLVIQADLDAWHNPGRFRLARVDQYEQLAFPVFEDEATSMQVSQVEGRLICDRDLIFAGFWLATGQEEGYWPKDQHGFMDLSASPMWPKQALREALASQISVWLENTLGQMGCPAPEPRWPQGKQAAAAVGHDVDYPEVIRWLEPLRILLRQKMAGIAPALGVLTGQRTHWQFPAWLELEKQLQTRSAFYFVSRQGSLREYATGLPDTFYDVTSPKFRTLFQHLIDEGWEVGLHASYLAYQSREKFAAEIATLEEASGHPVVGNRHHYWHMNPDNVEETLLIHEQVGLKYDTSLIHNRYLGWRRGFSQPFFPFHQAERRQLNTLQIPTAWMDDHLFGQRLDNPGDRDGLLSNLADRAATLGGCLLIDIHDYVFDDALFPQWTACYQRLWEYMLARGDFWFATPAQVAEHWIKRYNGLLEASQGLTEGTL